MSSRSCLARAPAKVNLALHVGAVRPDGFHDLATVYQAIDVYDEVHATRRADGRVCVETADPAGRPVAGIGADPRHLAVRAAVALRRRYGVVAGVHLEVRKDIPVAAGLAGGSADAAAALVACNAVWGLGLEPESLLDVAAELGSDVPFALVGGTALGTGRGEQVQSLTRGPVTTWVLVSSAPGLSTPVVYAHTDAARAHLPSDVPSGASLAAAPRVDPEFLAAIESGDTCRLARGLHNDLQPAAVQLRPGLVAVLAAGRAAGAAAVLVSGSGPSVLLLAHGDEHAAAVSAAVAPVAHEALTGAQLRTVHGPAAGAALTSGP